MNRYQWLFEMSNPNATDSDYEDGTGDGQYVVYKNNVEIKRFDGLEETEAFIKKHH